MYTLVLIRHGESIWNLENRFTGWTDVDLTPTGIAQARLAGERLKEAGFDLDGDYTKGLGGSHDLGGGLALAGS